MLRSEQILKRKRRPRGRPRSRSAPAVILMNPIKKRKLWTEQQMSSAIEAVKGGMKVFAAAREYNVPRMTLQDRISGRVIHGKNPGPQPYLNQAEEKELSNFLVETAKVGYGRSRKQVIQLVEKTAKDKGLLPPDKKNFIWVVFSIYGKTPYTCTP